MIKPIKLLALLLFLSIFPFVLSCGGGGGGGGNDGGSTSYTISGKVTDSNSIGISGVTMTLFDTASNTTTTDSNGNYSFNNLLNGNYTITPSKTGYTFDPTNRSVAVSNANVTGQDFVAGLTSTSATITGTVAGTTVVAVNENNNEIDSNIASGSPKTFTLTVPIGGKYKFYFIENEGTANEKVYPLYQGTTNVFYITSAVIIDLGFVDTTSGKAVPTNNPLDVSGVSSGGENSIIPPSLSFAGTYSFATQYDNNIKDGVTLNQSGTMTLEVTRNDANNLSIKLTATDGTFSVPLVRSGSVAKLSTHPYDIGTGNLLELLLLSDGNNTVFTFIGQEYNDLTDISLNVANWLRNSQSVTVDAFVGTWNVNYYSDPNLRDTTNGFDIGNASITISKVDNSTISVNIGNESLLLQVANGRATLINAPVTGVSAKYHAFSIVADGTGLSFYMVATEIDDPTDVSVTVGLATKQKQTYNIAEYFPLAQGDTWNYRDTVDGDLGTQTISGTENINGVNAAKKINEDSAQYQLLTNSNGLTYYKKYDANDIEGCGWSHSVFTPPITLCPAEVSIGAKYTSNFTTNYTDCRGESKTTTSSAEFTVEGIEDVTVPAGTFKDCLKIKIKFNNIFTDQGQIESGESTKWLAKEVGFVKEGTDELLSATVGGVHYPQ